MNHENYNEQTLQTLADLADLNKDGQIAFILFIRIFQFFNSKSQIAYDEFKLFEELLCSPDVLYKCAFQLFDKKGTGLIDFGKKLLFSFL